MAGRAVGKQHQLVAPLAERQEQRQQDREDVEPVADRDVDRHGARGRAQHEADRDRQHVENDDVLQLAGVQRQQQRRMTPPCTPKSGLQPERGRQRHRRQRHRPADGGRHGQGPGGNRPVLLDGMAPIRLPVRDIVDQVDDARERAEDDERGDGMEHRLHVQQPLGEHQWQEDDEVLRPLRRAEGQDEAQGHRPGGRRLRIDPLDESPELYVAPS